MPQIVQIVPQNIAKLVTLFGFKKMGDDPVKSSIQIGLEAVPHEFPKRGLTPYRAWPRFSAKAAES
jgi:hypothetical protein